jgi:hypothetical protein
MRTFLFLLVTIAMIVGVTVGTFLEGNWLWIVSLGAGMALDTLIVAPLLISSSDDSPKGFWYEGQYLVDGQDYHGENDRRLIEAHGIDALNFVPSTPPDYR